MKDGSEPTRDSGDAELVGELEKWPEVEEPVGGYAGLVIRATGRIGGVETTSTDDGIDVTVPPDLPPEDGEPDDEGPRRDRDSQAYIAARAALAAEPRKEEKTPGGMDAEGAESGKIDLKTLLAQGLILEGGPGAGTAPAEPQLAAAPVLMPAAAAPVQTTPEKKSRLGIWLVVAAVVLVGGFFLARGTGGPVADEQPGAELRGASQGAELRAVDRGPDRADEPRGRRGKRPRHEGEEEPGARAAGHSDEEEVASAEEDGVGELARADVRRRGPRGGGRHAPAPAPAEKASQPSPATAAPPPSKAPAPGKGRGAADLDALLSGAAGASQEKAGGGGAGGGGGAAAPAGPGPGALAQPNRAQIQTAMNRVAGAVRNCTQGTPGTAMVSVTFESGGSVTNSRVVSGYTGAVAACIAGAVRGARVPAFTRPNVTVTFPFVIRPPE